MIFWDFMTISKRLFIAYLLLAFLFVIYSYSQVDLNLTLSKNSFYLSFQEQMTYLGYYLRNWSTLIFISLSILLFGTYLLLLKRIVKRKERISGSWWKRVLIIGFVLWLAYPALSHDIFNYIFNAKIVWVYQRNPHIDVAAYFIHDVWLRFMHNVHTPAPYAYGWTAFSLIPGIATLSSKLKLSLWTMKLFIGLFWAGQLWILAKLVNKYFPKENWRWFLFALSPLVLIETLAVGHNDVVMMFFALTSYWFLLKSKAFFNKSFFLSLIFLGLSASIKYATIVLLPLWLIKLLRPKLDFPTLASFLLFGVIFARPDQLHSWYLIWAFSFAVLAKRRRVVVLFTSLTVGALLRYAPYLYYGNWDPPVYLLRNIIWLGVGLVMFLVFQTIHGFRKNS